MKKRLLQLISNDDGRLSRSQIMLWTLFFLVIGLLLAQVRCACVPGLSVPETLVVLGLFVMADRMGARWLSMKIGIAHIQFGTKEEAADA
jgi:hypothetical protein